MLLNLKAKALACLLAIQLVPGCNGAPSEHNYIRNPGFEDPPHPGKSPDTDSPYYPWQNMSHRAKFISPGYKSQHAFQIQAFRQLPDAGDRCSNSLKAYQHGTHLPPAGTNCTMRLRYRVPKIRENRGFLRLTVQARYTARRRIVTPDDSWHLSPRVEFSIQDPKNTDFVVFLDHSYVCKNKFGLAVLQLDNVHVYCNTSMSAGGVRDPE